MISKDKLEDYFAILCVIETNLAEYSKIVEDIVHIHGDVASLNNAIAQEKQLKLEQEGVVLVDRKEEAAARRESKVPELGDALSRLLNSKRKSISKVPSFRSSFSAR